MRLLVYLRDGRTVLRIVGRGHLSALLGHEPAGDHHGHTVDRGTWNPTTGEYVWRQGVRLRYLAKSSIAWVEEDRYTPEAEGTAA
jgi:hypothetical protein